jgi:hypothetical protein
VCNAGAGAKQRDRTSCGRSERPVSDSASWSQGRQESNATRPTHTFEAHSVDQDVKVQQFPERTFVARVAAVPLCTRVSNQPHQIMSQNLIKSSATKLCGEEVVPVTLRPSFLANVQAPEPHRPVAPASRTSQCSKNPLRLSSSLKRFELNQFALPMMTMRGGTFAKPADVVCNTKHTRIEVSQGREHEQDTAKAGAGSGQR